MTDKKVMEMMQNQEVQEAVWSTMMNYFDSQKNETVQNYRILNQQVKKGQIVLVGSSLMEQFPINEMQSSLGMNQIIYNRGVSGTTTSELLSIMDTCIFDLEPSKIFINIGSNDIGSFGTEGYKKGELIDNYAYILDQIKERLPKCEVFVMAYYPVNAVTDFGLPPERKRDMFSTRTNATISEANQSIEALAKKKNIIYIDVNNGLTDEEGNLKAEYSKEGIHLWANAYVNIFENMKKYFE